MNPGSATGAASSGWGWVGGPGGVGGVAGGASAADGTERRGAADAEDDADASADADADADADVDPVPSFVLMDVQGDVLVLYVYQLRTDRVRVEKVSYRKERAAAGAGPAAPAGGAEAAVGA